MQYRFTEDISSWDPTRVFTDPAYKAHRLRAMKEYLFFGTGVQKERLDIKAIHCSIEDGKIIAWVTLNERLNNILYREAAEKRRKGFKLFSSLPFSAQKRKKDILKYLKDINSRPKYKISTPLRNE